jgi:hypothetical protein
MTHAIETVFIDAILVRLLRELGLPETFPLIKLSPRMQDGRSPGQPSRACRGTSPRADDSRTASQWGR